MPAPNEARRAPYHPCQAHEKCLEAVPAQRPIQVSIGLKSGSPLVIAR